MNHNQGTFNFDSDDNKSGYDNWQEELATRVKQLETRYGIIIGSKVRIILHGENKPLDGIITICDSKEPQNRSQLRLRIASRIITLAEIESITRL